MCIIDVTVVTVIGLSTTNVLCPVEPANVLELIDSNVADCFSPNNVVSTEVITGLPPSPDRYMTD